MLDEPPKLFTPPSCLYLWDCVPRFHSGDALLLCISVECGLFSSRALTQSLIYSFFRLLIVYSFVPFVIRSACVYCLLCLSSIQQGQCPFGEIETDDW